MSTESRVEAVRVEHVRLHPDADRLDVVRVLGDYALVVGRGQFEEGDIAAFVPHDMMVPVADPRFAFLASRAKDGMARVKASRLRGVFSAGLLVPVDGAEVGDDLTEALGCVKYEPELSPDLEPDPGCMAKFTDIQPWRRYGRDVFDPDEEVVVTEKIHGASARFLWRDGRLWCGSRVSMVREAPGSPWWVAAEHHGLGPILCSMPGLAVYGEVYGQVQDLKYGVASGTRFAAFDVVDTRPQFDGRFADYDDFVLTCDHAGIPRVPELYRGPLRDAPIAEFAEGPSVIGNGACIREGVVVRPIRERRDDRIGRVILKLHGQGFWTRKQRKGAA